MKMIITILEDRTNELEQLKKLLDTWSKERKFYIDIRTFSSGEQYLESKEPLSDDTNLFILDIQMNKLTGIDIAKKLRYSGYNGYIIFLTAFREYVFSGYEVHALNYLLKPIQANTLFLCLDEIAKNLTGNSYFYRNKQEIVNIPYKNILCFSSSLHSIDILTVSAHYTQYATLNNIIKYLPNEFVRVHRSYIVNMEHIHKISGNTITLSNHMTVQIGRSYIKQIYSAFTAYSSRFDIL